MSDEKKECCGTCRFGRVKPINLKEVDCYRYPSQVTATLVMTKTGEPAPMYINATPTMESADWCGEYQPKKGLLN